MPEFILDLGSSAAARTYHELDSFTQGYIEAMFFTSTGTGDDGDLENAAFDQLAPDTIEAIKSDCHAFQQANAALLEQAYGQQGRYEQEPYDATRAGHDYWYTRNGHGTGFWDRGLGDVGDRLADVTRYHDKTLYCGDDGLLYLE